MIKYMRSGDAVETTSPLCFFILEGEFLMTHHSKFRLVFSLCLALIMALSTVPVLAADAKPAGTTRFEAVSFYVTDSKEKNMATIQKYIDQGGANDVDLMLFPELSTCGLPEGISMNTVDENAKAFFPKNAEPVPGGPTCDTMIANAKKYNMYLCWSMLEQDPYDSSKVYNTAVLVGPEGFIGKYLKVHLAGTESYMEEAGTEYSKVFDTKLGKIALVICFDKTYPDTVRQAKIDGADIVLAPSSWPGLDKRLSNLDPSMQLYRWSGKARNVENGVVFVETNWASGKDDTTNAEAGHARISDATGKTYGETGWEEGTVTADIDVQKSIDEYYKNLGMTRDEHIAYLKEKQDQHKKTSDTAGVVETNIKFYGSAIGNTILDLGDALRFGALGK